MRYALPGLLLLAAACAAPPPDPMVESVNESWVLCDEAWRKGELQSREARARCIARGEIPHYKEAQYRHLDLIRLLNEKRIELARREDRGQVTPAAAEAEWTSAVIAVSREEARRNRLIVQDLEKRVTSQPQWLRKQRPDYVPAVLERLRCHWVGSRLSCRVA